MVVPDFKVKNDTPKKQENSDMGSDCAYFSGNEGADNNSDAEPMGDYP
jgi:hypothetical protein